MVGQHGFVDVTCPLFANQSDVHQPHNLHEQEVPPSSAVYIAVVLQLSGNTHW